MFLKPSILLVLVSGLSHYYVSGAVVSLLVPLADPDEAIAGKFLGTDAEGHTSWSLGPGATSGAFTNTDFAGVTVIAGATDVHEVGALSTVLDGVTVTLTASAGCAVVTDANGPVSAACSASGQAVGAFSGTSTTTAVTTAFTSKASLIAIQVPDSGSGAVPTASSTSSSGATATSGSGTASGTGSAPASTSTGNTAVKEKFGWGVAGVAGLLLVGLV